MKTKKLLIAIIIMIFAILTLGCNKSFALTDEEKQKILDAIPNEIKLDITDLEYVNGIYDENSNPIKKQIDLILKEKNLPSDELFIYGPSIFEKEVSFKNSSNLKKDITISYSNADKRNAEDEAAAKAIQIEKFKAYEFECPLIPWDTWSDEDYCNFGEEVEKSDFWYKPPADSSISIIVRQGSGGDPFNTGSSLTVYIFNKGVLYDECRVEATALPVLTVPNSVKDDELNDYIISSLKKVFTKSEITIQNEDVYNLGRYFPNEKNLYIFNASEMNVEGGLGIQYHYMAIKVRREEQKTENSAVATSDKNVRLDTTTDVVPENTVIEVKTIEKSNITVLEDDMNFVAYDIKLKSNGVEIQPNGKVKISIPVPDGFDTSRLVVYRIEEDGNKVEYKVNIVTIDNKKYAQFETEHFSTYVLAETTVAPVTPATPTNPDTTEAPSKPEHILDDTPKTGRYSILPYLVVTGIIISLILVKNKNKKRVK